MSTYMYVVFINIKTYFILCFEIKYEFVEINCCSHNLQITELQVCVEQHKKLIIRKVYPFFTVFL